VFEYKISSFFLILVLLLSVTNLPTFSTTQLNSDSNNLNGLSINLFGVAFADHKDSHKVSHDDSYDDSHDDSYDDSHGKKDKVTICHIPPGNPANAGENPKNVSTGTMIIPPPKPIIEPNRPAANPSGINQSSSIIVRLN